MSTTDRPNILIHPLAGFFGILLAGGAAYYVWPFGWGLYLPSMGLGLALIAYGYRLRVKCFDAFKEEGTPMNPRATPTTLVTTGPYSWSRNPLYLSGNLLYLGIGLFFGNGWILCLFMPFFLMKLHTVDREEAYLAEKFGEDYMEYQSLVRRWL